MKHQPLYREVLRQAWDLTWRHKIILVLGLFAAFLGTGGALEVLARHFNLIFNPQPWLWSWPWRLEWVGGWDLATRFWAVALALLLAGLAIFFIFAVINSFSSLIAAADRFRANKKVDLFALWHQSRGHFWPVLAQVVFFKVLILLFGFLSLAPLWLVFISQAGAWLLLFYPLLFLLSVLAILICSFLMIYAAAFTVLEDEGWWSAILEAWHLFAKHWLVNVEMAAVIFVINFAVGLLALAIGFVLAIPFLIVFFASLMINLPPLGATAIVVGLILTALLILFSAAFLGAFQVSVWILLFRRMHKDKARSKLVRVIHHLGEWIKNR